MTEPTRRSLLKGISWAAPTVVVSVAAPAIAASVEKDIIVFTNVTATEGKEKNTIYANTKVMVTTGDSVSDLVVEIQALDQVCTTNTSLPPWGATDIIECEFPDIPKGAPIPVYFRAWGSGVAHIESVVTFNPPSWWD